MIYLRAMRLRCIVGILPEERKRKRLVVATLRLAGDICKAGRTDDIADAVDYREVQRRVEKAVGGSRDGLIERLAERIAEAAGGASIDMGNIGKGREVNVRSITMATMIVTILPIVLVYPFLQKYFIKGIMVGSLKG